MGLAWGRMGLAWGRMGLAWGRIGLAWGWHGVRNPDWSRCEPPSPELGRPMGYGPLFSVLYLYLYYSIGPWPAIRHFLALLFY
jgi:hypothetical protein